MPEPTSTTTAAVVTIAAAGVSIPMLTAFGIPLGLRADILVAGLFGSLVSIILLNSVPSLGDTWQLMLRTALRRMSVALASSVTAGYVTPMLMPTGLSDPMLLGAAFVVGGGAQKIFASAIDRFSTKAGSM